MHDEDAGSSLHATPLSPGSTHFIGERGVQAVFVSGFLFVLFVLFVFIHPFF
jgi:hypothetical protein